MRYCVVGPKLKNALTEFISDIKDAPGFLGDKLILCLNGNYIQTIPIEAPLTSYVIDVRFKDFTKYFMTREECDNVHSQVTPDNLEGGINPNLVVTLLLRGFSKGLSGDQILQSLRDLGCSIPSIKLTRNYITGGYSFRKLESQSEDESGGSYVLTTFEEAVRLLDLNVLEN